MIKLSIIGYLGADCNVKRVNNSDQVAITFSVGVSDQYKNRQGEQINKTTWIGCTLWRKPEHTRISEFLKKGVQVYVEGEPNVRAWIKQGDNTAAASFDCRVTEIKLLGKGPAQVSPDPAPGSNTSSSAPVFSNPTDNDDLPF
jgi:single-strand DNA-binding protein